jgi:hypothetical protein
MVEIMLDLLIRVASVGHYIRSTGEQSNLEYNASEYTLVTQVVKMILVVNVGVRNDS